MLKLPANLSIFISSIAIFGLNIPVLAQLPPTNLGKFVHQPGDNQYTYQTQSERHSTPTPAIGVPVSVSTSSTPPSSGDYKLTPAAPKPDISLLPIVADEPLKPAGFPPLPDRLDLPTNGVWSGAGGGDNQSVLSSATLNRNYNSSPTGVHQHYVHYEAGAFMPKEQAQSAPQIIYKPASSDYYNVNPGARPVYGPVRGGDAGSGNSETPATQALHRMGAEPQLAADAISKPEAPAAVTVNQSVSQDLSLPEDDFNKHYPTNIGNSANSRVGNGIGHMLMYPARSLMYTGIGMGTGMAASTGVYALHR